MRTARRASERDFIAILLAVNHAMRISEVTSIRTPAIDLANRLITVKRLKGSKTTLHEIPSDKEPLLDELAALSEYLKHVKEGERLIPICRQHLFNLFRGYVRDAGLPMSLARFHNAKHTSLQTLAPLVPLPMLQKFSGHCSLSSLGRYLEPSQAQTDAAVRAARMAVSA